MYFSFDNLFAHREADMTKERIEKLLKAGANVVLTAKGIDDMALKVSFFVDQCHLWHLLTGWNSRDMMEGHQFI